MRKLCVGLIVDSTHKPLSPREAARWRAALSRAPARSGRGRAASWGCRPSCRPRGVPVGLHCWRASCSRRAEDSGAAGAPRGVAAPGDGAVGVTQWNCFPYPPPPLALLTTRREGLFPQGWVSLKAERNVGRRLPRQEPSGPKEATATGKWCSPWISTQINPR